MKTSKLILSIVIPVALLTTGCRNCGAPRSEPPAPLSFYLVDQQGSSLFGASNRQYHPDSLSLTLDNEPFTYVFSGLDKNLDNVVFEAYPVLYNKDSVRLVLHHNGHNADTLDIAYTLNRTECYTSYSYTSIHYNGREVEPNPVTGHLQLSLHEDAPSHTSTALLQ